MCKKRIMALIVSLVMMLSVFCTGVYAADVQDNQAQVGCSPSWFMGEELMAEAAIYVEAEDEYTYESRMYLKSVMEQVGYDTFSYGYDDICALEAAIDALVPLGQEDFEYDKTEQELENKIEIACRYTWGHYTKKSLDVLVDAIYAAQDALDCRRTDEYEYHIDAIDRAIDGLRDSLFYDEEDEEYVETTVPLDLYLLQDLINQAWDILAPGNCYDNTQHLYDAVVAAQADLDNDIYDNLSYHINTIEFAIEEFYDYVYTTAEDTSFRNDETEILRPLRIGDTDGDGDISVRDATLIQKHVADLIFLSEDILILADTDGNEDVNVKDATAIQKYVADFEFDSLIGLVPESPTEPPESQPDIEEGAKDIFFMVVDEMRVGEYGTDKTELYLIKSREQAMEVLEKFSDSDYYDVPALDEKYNDAFFEENSLIVSLNFVGGSCCTQGVDRISVDGNTLTVFRTIYKEEMPTPDMKYEYVLMEVSAKDTKNVTELFDSTDVVYNTTGSDPGYGEEYTTIYFSNTQNWSAVNIYYWGQEDLIWPGVPMVYVGVNTYGQDVYKYQVPVNTAGIVFNDSINAEQTVDIMDGIRNNIGFYPSEQEGGRWNVGSYIYNEEEMDTVFTETTVMTIPEETSSGIDYEILEEGRVESYADGSDETLLYLVKSPLEAEDVFATIKSDDYGSYYIKPALPQECDDDFFKEYSLIVSLNCVGGSNCSQNIDRIQVEDDKLIVHRSIYQPDNVLCDMNYQYVLIKVKNSDIAGVEELLNINS